jgi:hypothetical protein
LPRQPSPVLASAQKHRTRHSRTRLLQAWLKDE